VTATGVEPALAHYRSATEEGKARGKGGGLGQHREKKAERKEIGPRE
jgi:hypothetical protein